MVYRASDQVLYLPTVDLFERPKAPDIKMLEQMRRIRRHTKRDDAILLTVYLKVGRVAAFMPIEDQKAMAAL